MSEPSYDEKKQAYEYGQSDASEGKYNGLLYNPITAKGIELQREYIRGYNDYPENRF